jgi:ATP-dependent Clp protease ATP-binding subunit ClpX
MSVETPLPIAIAEGISQRVVGQDEAVREVSIALAKRLAGLRTGNVLMIGSSGTGKTTLMRAVEEYLGADEALAAQTMLIRVHANVLAEHAEEGRGGEVLLRRLLDKAREDLGRDVEVDTLLERVGRGIVFVDEVDKIRAWVGDQPNVPGIRAQESLLTLIENEAIPFSLPDWAGGGTVTFDASHLLFVCAGAFEGLYDAVYDRITVGRDRGTLQGVSVMEGGQVHHEMRFSLRDWLRYEDLFDYGMTPQFLSRFDAHVLLNDLGQRELVDIFLNSPESGYHETRAYFEAVGVQLAISPAAVRRIAQEAGKQPRLGARALKEVFRRVVRDYEFAPHDAARDGTLMIDLPEVDSALGD